MKSLPECVTRARAQLSSAFIAAILIANNGCSYCGPEQHAISTSGSNMTLGGDIPTRDIQYVMRRLTEPPATHDQFEFLFNTLEGETNGEGVKFTLPGTDAVTQEVVTLVLALPVTLREGDQYSVGGTFSVDVGAASEAGFWGAHNLVDPNKADVAFVVSTYSFPPPVSTPTFTAVTSTGTIRVASRSPGQVQLILNLTFTDSDGHVRIVTGNAQANTEKFDARCN
jgi:hypothetical protein